jgi:hypothetical protein
MGLRPTLANVVIAPVAATVVAACSLLLDGDAFTRCRDDADCAAVAGARCDLEARRCVSADTAVEDAAVADAEVADTGAAREDVVEPPRATYRDAVLADGPVAYFRLGESAGTSAHDEVQDAATGRYVHDVTLGAEGALSDDPDTAIALAGGGVVTIGRGFAFSGRAPFSIEMWLKPSAIDATHRWAFARQIFETPRNGYGIYLVEHEGISLERWIDGSSRSTGAPIEVGRFSHVVASYDGASLRVHVDGALGASLTDARDLLEVDAEACVGATRPTASSAFRGVIDEVAIYDKALDPARIRAHFELGRR